MMSHPLAVRVGLMASVLVLASCAPGKGVILESMKVRGTGQMPPNALEVDFAGIAAVEAFVRSLPAP